MLGFLALILVLLLFGLFFSCRMLFFLMVCRLLILVALLVLS